ncbi:MAG: hypothetical protein ABL925_18825 [Methylococcales bacterium]
MLISAAPVLPATFDYLYIEANEGNSSGGHSAIQFGDEVFHYQHQDSGLIRLLRQDKQEFHFLYRFLQNRRIHLSRIEVSAQTFALLNSYFKEQFLTQDQQFKQINALQRDRLVLQRLLHDSAAETSTTLKLKGVGLFYSDRDLILQNTANVPVRYNRRSPAIASVRKKIEQSYGQDFLLQRREQITASIKALKTNHWPVVRPILPKDHFPPAMTSFADSYEDYLTGLAAIKILQEQQPLRAEAFFITPEPVTPEQKPVLQRLQQQLTVSLIKSVNSGRPDWGYATIVNLARLLAVDVSLQLGQWTFVDDFADDSEWIAAPQFTQYAAQMHTQIDDARANLLQARNALFSNDGLTETNYSRLEMAANRYVELRKGLQQQGLRYIGENALPTKSTAVPDWPAPELTAPQLKTALSELDHYETDLLQELTQQYRYDLLSRNCVTELFRSIDQALLQPSNTDIDPAQQAELLSKQATERLGGVISASYNFIPFISFQSVQSRYNVTATAVLNSYRGQQSAKQEGLPAALRESNTFSSTLYPYNPDDAFFIFFTDENLLLRPLFGVFNTAAGIGQSVTGLLSWPFDSGHNLKSGATGILMSLPELVFFNMRKGSYKYLSYRQFVNSDAAKF